MKQYIPIVINDQVTEDAVKLLKSDFTALYKELGHDPVRIAALWHDLRVSPKGLKIRAGIKSPLINQATSFISDIAEEVLDRKQSRKRKDKSILGEKATEESEVSESNNKPLNLNNKTMAEEKKEKGEKGARAQSFIDQGVIDPKELSEKAGISKVYAGRLLEKAGKLVKKEKTI